MIAPLPFTPGSRYATVQLRHERADEPTHVDWMIASTPVDAPPTGVLVTFRLDAPLAAKAAAGSAARLERIADHRPRYLDYEGPISGDRGAVTRIWRGVFAVARVSADAVEGELRDAAAASTLAVRLASSAGLSEAAWRCDFLDT